MTGTSRWALRLALVALPVVALCFATELLLEVGVLDPTGKAEARKENLAYQRPLRVEARRAQGADAWVSLHPHLFIPTEGIPDGEASLYWGVDRMAFAARAARGDHRLT
jgi:hypothetical protein